MDIEKRVEEIIVYKDGVEQKEAILSLIREAVAEVTPPPGHILTDDGVVHFATRAMVDLHDIPDDGVTLRVCAIITDAAIEEAKARVASKEVGGG